MIAVTQNCVSGWHVSFWYCRYCRYIVSEPFLIFSVSGATELRYTRVSTETLQIDLLRRRKKGKDFYSSSLALIFLRQQKTPTIPSMVTYVVPETH